MAAASGYRPPLRDLRFVLDELLGVSDLLRQCGSTEFDTQTIDQVLSAAGEFAAEVIAPLNGSGDREGCRVPEPGVVATPQGFRSAYLQFVENGWAGLGCASEYGGQDVPSSVSSAVSEMLSGANMAWAAYPGMSHAAYMCIEANGTPAQKALYLPRIVAGEWAGTMCLTEAHAGTDLGLLRTRAVERPDGGYEITGSKIFISGGEQDLTENIVHLVLARMKGSPPGVKGISLFIVPKFLPDTHGEPGARNALACASIEEKMGIHGNATCTMNFDCATGWLLGEADKGLAAMFVMMNHARIAVGVNAIGLMDAAYQKALAYAKERTQGRALGRGAPAAMGGGAEPIIAHVDVRRMLLTQKAYVEGSRAFALWATTLIDVQHRHHDAEERVRAGRLLALVTPVVKAFCSDLAVESILLAMQCFGGHGYIRANGVEQHMRDARIIPLYEGTNGVQAMDLLGRKVLGDGGKSIDLLLNLIQDWAAAEEGTSDLGEFVVLLDGLVKDVRDITAELVATATSAGETAGAASTPYLRLIGHLMLAWMWLRMAALASRKGEAAEEIHRSKLATARFYYQRLLPEAMALCLQLRAGASSISEPVVDLF